MTWTDPEERLPEPGVVVEVITTRDTIIPATLSSINDSGPLVAERRQWRVGGRGRTVIYIVNVAKWRERPCEENAIKLSGGDGGEVGDSLFGE